MENDQPNWNKDLDDLQVLTGKRKLSLNPEKILKQTVKTDIINLNKRIDGLEIKLKKLEGIIQRRFTRELTQKINRMENDNYGRFSGQESNPK